ncbi:MAG: DNA-3-methyladenine glycosylase 2 family protein [Gemmatimonadota bacterium]
MSSAQSRRLSNATLRQGVRYLTARDPILAGVVRRHGPPPMWGRPPGFSTMVRIILDQQVSLAAARTMYLRLEKAAGAISHDVLAEFGVERMRGLGFTRQKSAYIHELALELAAGTLDLGAIARGEDQAGRARLTELRGFGPWSVDIYYLMALRRPDIWPHGDLALADAIHRLGYTRSRADYDRIRKLAERWAPWRSVAARILWHHYLESRR